MPLFGLRGNQSNDHFLDLVHHDVSDEGPHQGNEQDYNHLNPQVQAPCRGRIEGQPTDGECRQDEGEEIDVDSNLRRLGINHSPTDVPLMDSTNFSSHCSTRILSARLMYAISRTFENDTDSTSMTP